MESQETNILFFYCLAREETEVVQLSLFGSPYFQPQPLPPFSLSTPRPLLFFTLSLWSITAHIWFWVKARLVSCGMEGFYFSMAPLPLQFHSAVGSMQCVYELVSLSSYWFYSVLIFITGEPHNHPQLMASRSGNAGSAGGHQGFTLAPYLVSVPGDFVFLETVYILESSRC